jgi:hypothetical protein
MEKEQTATTILNERTFAIPLPIVLSVVVAVAGAVVWGVRQLDHVTNELRAIRAALSIGWTINHQREWVLEAKQKSDLPDPDVIFNRNQPK